MLLRRCIGTVTQVHFKSAEGGEVGEGMMGHWTGRSTVRGRAIWTGMGNSVCGCMGCQDIWSEMESVGSGGDEETFKL